MDIMKKHIYKQWISKLTNYNKKGNGKQPILFLLVCQSCQFSIFNFQLFYYSLMQASNKRLAKDNGEIPQYYAEEGYGTPVMKYIEE